MRHRFGVSGLYLGQYRVSNLFLMETICEDCGLVLLTFPMLCQIWNSIMPEKDSNFNSTKRTAIMDDTLFDIAKISLLQRTNDSELHTMAHDIFRAIDEEPSTIEGRDFPASMTASRKQHMASLMCRMLYQCGGEHLYHRWINEHEQSLYKQKNVEKFLNIMSIANPENMQAPDTLYSSRNHMNHASRLLLTEVGAVYVLDCTMGCSEDEKIATGFLYTERRHPAVAFTLTIPNGMPRNLLIQMHISDDECAFPGLCEREKEFILRRGTLLKITRCRPTTNKNNNVTHVEATVLHPKGIHVGKWIQPVLTPL
jgi:hypothetical protein